MDALKALAMWGSVGKTSQAQATCSAEIIRSKKEVALLNRQESVWYKEGGYKGEHYWMRLEKCQSLGP